MSPTEQQIQIATMIYYFFFVFMPILSFILFSIAYLLEQIPSKKEIVAPSRKEIKKDAVAAWRKK